MPAGLAVEPSRLTLAGAQVRVLGNALALAGRDVARSLDDAQAELAGQSAGDATGELAAAGAGAVHGLVVAVDRLADGLAAAAARYLAADVLSGTP